jgi:cell division protein FtsA
LSKPEIIAGIDIGSGQLACTIGRRMPENDHVEVIAATRQNCRGLKGGVVINIDETALSISRVVEAAEEMAKETVRDLIVGIRGSHIQTFNHHGAINIARTDKEITTDDVAQVIESTKAVPISTDREIIHVIPQDFVLDRQQGVPNPVGMEGSLLEVEVHIVTAGSSHLNNIWRSINNAGFGIREPVYGLLALGDVVVTQEEKDLGCMLIDLGGATTGIAMYTDGGVRFTKELPIGADAITNDLAHGLRTAFSQAKMVKERYGAAVRVNRRQILVAGHGQDDGIDPDEEISYTCVDGRTQRQIQRSTLFDFISPRVEEIFSLVRNELDRYGRAGRGRRRHRDRRRFDDAGYGSCRRKDSGAAVPPGTSAERHGASGNHFSSVLRDRGGLAGVSFHGGLASHAQGGRPPHRRFPHEPGENIFFGHLLIGGLRNLNHVEN